MDISPYLDTIISAGLLSYILLTIILFILLEIFFRLLLRLIGFLVKRTDTTLDDRIFEIIKKFSPYLSILIGLWISGNLIFPNSTIGNYKTEELYLIGFIALFGVFLSSIADALLIWYGHGLHQNTTDEDVFPFVRQIIRIAIILIFAVFILQRLGFETGAIITSLGVGGLAVALALQDTLGNFFGGVHILVDKPFKEKDYIKMENGLEGTVKKIGWRTTRIYTVTNNEIVVPNSKLSGSILENFSAPFEKTTITNLIGVSYDSDIDLVEKILTTILLEISKKHSLDDKSLWVRFESFGDYSLNFRYGYSIEYVNRWPVQKEINKEIFYRFKKKGINIPYPSWTIYSPKTKNRF